MDGKGSEGAPVGVRLEVGGPLTRRNHEDAVLLAAPLDRRLVDMASSRCHGRRSFGRPMIALTTKKNLGSVRHAISQMVVAGVMVVTPPIQVPVPQAPPRDENSRGTGDERATR